MIYGLIKAIVVSNNYWLCLYLLKEKNNCGELIIKEKRCDGKIKLNGGRKKLIKYVNSIYKKQLYLIRDFLKNIKI